VESIVIFPDTEFEADVITLGPFMTDAILTLTSGTDTAQIEFKSLGAIEQAASAILNLYLKALREQELAIKTELDREEGYTE